MDAASVGCAWTNGARATVYLLEYPDGNKLVLKKYKPGHFKWMMRDYLNSMYVSMRLSNVPKLLHFSLIKRELVFSYVRGTRVLEWVLQQFGDPGLDILEFLNFEAMDTDHRIVRAFKRFRDSDSEPARRLKQAIRDSYARLHAVGIQHGTADPRNVIYDERQVYIIDFDRARPAWNRRKVDYRALTYWFGVYPEFPK